MDLFGVTGSGIMLADEQNVPRYVATSDVPGRMLEVVESDTGQGACTDCVDDPPRRPRWLARSLPDASGILDELTRCNVKLSLGGSIHDPTIRLQVAVQRVGHDG